MKQKKVKQYSWLIQARYENQTLLLKLFEFNESEMDAIERKIYNLLIGTAFSLWRAAFLANETREDPIIQQNSDFVLDRLIADNSINYPQDIISRQWMSGYYLNNARLRILQIKKDLMLSQKNKTEIDCSIIENKRLSECGDLLEHWNDLHKITLGIFESHYRGK